MANYQDFETTEEVKENFPIYDRLDLVNLLKKESRVLIELRNEILLSDSVLNESRKYRDEAKRDYLALKLNEMLLFSKEDESIENDGFDGNMKIRCEALKLDLQCLNKELYVGMKSLETLVLHSEDLASKTRMNKGKLIDIPALFVNNSEDLEMLLLELIQMKTHLIQDARSNSGLSFEDTGDKKKDLRNRNFTLKKQQLNHRKELSRLKSEYENKHRIVSSLVTERRLLFDSISAFSSKKSDWWIDEAFQTFVDFASGSIDFRLLHVLPSWILDLESLHSKIVQLLDSLGKPQDFTYAEFKSFCNKLTAS